MVYARDRGLDVVYVVNVVEVVDGVDVVTFYVVGLVEVVNVIDRGRSSRSWFLLIDRAATSSRESGVLGVG